MTEAARRYGFGALAHRNFRLFFIGQGRNTENTEGQQGEARERTEHENDVSQSNVGFCSSKVWNWKRRPSFRLGFFGVNKKRRFVIADPMNPRVSATSRRALGKRQGGCKPPLLGWRKPLRTQCPVIGCSMLDVHPPWVPCSFYGFSTGLSDDR